MGYYAWPGSAVGAKKEKEGGKGEVVTSFTAIDKSPQMLAIARTKFATEHPAIEGVRWVVQDASTPLPPAPSGGKYDTILQTMGLCSTPNPASLIRNLGAHLAPNGRILLLEHGRSEWGFVNTILDSLAPRHAEKFGCWWNRDIGAIVRESGLEVVEVRRRNWGTTWWVELRLPEGGK